MEISDFIDNFVLNPFRGKTARIHNALHSLLDYSKGIPISLEMKDGTRREGTLQYLEPAKGFYFEGVGYVQAKDLKSKPVVLQPLTPTQNA